MPGLRIRNSAFGEIEAHASADYPEEACGFMIGIRPPDPDAAVIVERVRVASNVAPPEVRKRRFEIDPRAVIELQRSLRTADQEIVGFYHSHPDNDARLSATDLPFVRLWPRTAWLIVEVRADGAPAAPRAWWLEHHEDEPVEMRIAIDGDPAEDVTASNLP